MAQLENSRASLAVGRRMMEDLRFSGYIYIFDEDDDDAAGVVFNYQNNKNFYVLLGTRTDSNQVGKSLQCFSQIYSIFRDSGS